METLKKQFQEHRFMGMYSKECIDFITSCFEKNNKKELLKYGEDIHHIELNYRNYIAGKVFGFEHKHIEKTKYGWFKCNLLNVSETEINQGNKIKVGKGINGKWTYSTGGNYGAAGYGSPLSVFTSNIFNTKKEAEIEALKKLKSNHQKYLGDSDTTNYKQSFIKKTIKLIDIEISKRVNINFEFTPQQYSFGEQMQLF